MDIPGWWYAASAAGMVIAVIGLICSGVALYLVMSRTGHLADTLRTELNVLGGSVDGMIAAADQTVQAVQARAVEVSVEAAAGAEGASRQAMKFGSAIAGVYVAIRMARSTLSFIRAKRHK